MKVGTWKPGMTAESPGCVAVGVFDGVHVGHVALLETTVADARDRGALAVALTFDRDPDQILAPAHAAPQLLALEDKLAFLGETGLDSVIVVPFTEELASMEPRAFLGDVLGPSIGPVAVHVGVDFRFGSHATGSVDTLESWGEQNAIAIHPHALLEIDGLPVTSTRIRSLIAEGEVDHAGRLLGRPPRISGTVRTGRGEGGARLGIPTANVAPAAFAALPSPGVYAGRAWTADADTRWPAAISIGVPPTFPQARDTVEAHLIGYEGSLLGRDLVLEFVSRLRDQLRFDSDAALAEQIRADISFVQQHIRQADAE